MSCKNFEDQIIEYLDGELRSDSIAALEEHLQACSACSAEFAATKEALATLDGALANPPEMDVEAGLSAVRQRLREEEAKKPAVSWSASLRWWLGGGLAAAAAGLLAVTLTGVEPTYVNTEVPPSSEQSAGTAGLPPRAEAAKMMELLEEMPLYENLDCFQEYDHLTALLDENPEKLEEILREVQG
jgi:anti-sigma factor RsiW